MISQLQLSGFKTFSVETHFDFNKLVVLAGTNSAGKSTVIQAIAALKQSIEEAPPVGSLELNGPYVRLGGFKDAVSRHAESRAFRIGFTASEPDGTASVSYLFREDAGRPAIAELRYLDQQQEFVYEVCDLPERVRVVLRRLNLQHALSVRSRRDVWAAMVGLVPNWEISFEPSDANISLREHLRRFATERIVEVMDFLLGRISASGARTRNAIEEIENQMASESLQDIVALLDRLLEATGLQGDKSLTDELLSEKEAELLSNELHPHQMQLLEKLLQFSETELDVVAVCEDLVRDATVLPATGYSVRESSESGSISRCVSDLFAKVFYLGPLRRPPMLSYSDKSEHLSRILPDGTGLMAHLKSRWQDRAAFGAPDGAEEAKTVGECVSAWCRHLGICEGLEIQGGVGLDYEVKFIPLNDHKKDSEVSARDLPTNVGVGVTQLLPVIALLVIADTGSTCLFEQPELHLHPSAQTKLAELFVAAVKVGRQLIVETHSEHLINGIRLAVAGQLLDPNDIRMIFVASKAGGSQTQTVEMDRRGLIDSWPSGFFDEAEKGAVRLLGAALRARK